MFRVLLIAVTVLFTPFKGINAAPIDAINFNLMTGLESDRDTENPAGISIAELQLECPQSSWRPGLGLGTSFLGRDQLSLRPVWSISAQYRLDIIEFIPYTSARMLGSTQEPRWYRAALTFGIERLYQSGWLTMVEIGTNLAFERERNIGGIILLGLGYRYTLDELY